MYDMSFIVYPLLAVGIAFFIYFILLIVSNDRIILKKEEAMFDGLIVDYESINYAYDTSREENLYVMEKLEKYVNNSDDKHKALFDTYIIKMDIVPGFTLEHINRIKNIDISFKKTGKVLEWEGKVQRCIVDGEKVTRISTDKGELIFKGVDNFIVGNKKARYKIAYYQKDNEVIENYKVVDTVEVE